ncbi:MAG: hypothetical protein ABJH45_03415 [Paracoccaceae bacterium]
MINLKAVALAMCVFPGIASAQLIACNVKSNGSGFVSPTIAFDLDAEAKTALVYDSVIHFVYQKPIAARVKQKSNGEWQFTWNLTVPANPADAKIRYRAVLDLKKNKVQLSGSIRHATNKVGGTGNCLINKDCQLKIS